MSYNIVSSINLKEHTIKSAENNVRPLLFRKVKREGLTDKQFLRDCLYSFNIGTLQTTSMDYWKFNYAATLAWQNHRDEILSLRKIRDDANVTQEERDAATEKITDFLEDAYYELKHVKKEKYVIKYYNCYVVKRTERNLFYTDYVNRAKTFSSLEEAKCYMNIHFLSEDDAGIKLVKLSECE